MNEPIKRLIRRIGKLLFLILLFFSFFLQNTSQVQANEFIGDSYGRATKKYGNYDTYTPFITINGVIAYCIDPYLTFPTGHEYIEHAFNDVGVYNILYYADLHEMHKKESTYVDVHVALNWYLGHPTSQAKKDDPNVRWLYNKAKNPNAPTGDLEIENKSQTATYTEGNNYQETGWYKPKTDGNNLKYTVSVPTGISVISSDGKNHGSGSVTLSQNHNFKLRADLDYSGTINVKVDTNILKKMALMYIPAGGAPVQNLASLNFKQDPATIPNITARFYKRTGRGSGAKVDETTGANLSGAVFSVTNLQTGETGTVTTGSSGSVNWGEAIIGETISITEIKAPYRYINNYQTQTMTIQAGNNNNVRFENDKMAELQFQKIEIYTDKADNGLPIVLHTNVIQSSPTADRQSVNVVVYEKETGRKVLSLPYKIGELPKKINAKIPSEYLNVDQKRNYVAQFEFNSRYAYTTSGKDKIDTDGYTSSEELLSVNAVDTHTIEYKGVIKTERTVQQEMKEYYEYFSVPTNRLVEQKTGYGFSRDFQTNYINELNNPTAFSVKVAVDPLLIDSYLPYSHNGGLIDVPLEEPFDGNYQLPRVNVERKTGNLFTNEQIYNGDSRIEHEIIDGGRKLYVPIWGNVGEYPVSTSSTSPIGVNQINFNIDDSLEIYAHMYAHMNSETFELDEIIMSPVLHDQPFGSGIPDNWGYAKSNGTKELTDEEKEWFEKDPTEQKITIHFDLNGGSGTFPNTAVTIGESYRLSSNEPTKANVVFDGWKWGVNTYKSGTEIKSNQDITLIAQWKNKKRSITFNPMGGKGEPTNMTVNVGSEVTISNQIPIKSEKTFTGWKNGVEGSTYQTEQSFVMPDRDLNLEAQWSTAVQDIVFNGDGGENIPENTKAETNSEYVLPNIEPIKKDHSFKGWIFDAVVYQLGEIITIPNKTVTFVADWEKDTIIMSFDGNGGENEPYNQTIEVNSMYSLPDTIPSKQFHLFEGWEYDGTIYQPKDEIETKDTDITFKAKWTSDTQLISFDNNGGISDLTTDIAKTDSDYTIPNDRPKKEGYTFEGWEYEGTVYQPNEILYVRDSDITLTAQYEIGRYKLIHDGNGAESGMPYDVEVGTNKIYKIPDEDNQIPIRTGYTFIGWENDYDQIKYQPGDIITVYADTILTALWEINQYQVHFDLNGGSSSFNSITQDYDSIFTVPTKIPSWLSNDPKISYDFIRWERIDTGVTYYPGDTFIIPSHDVSLRAIWRMNKEVNETVENDRPSFESSISYSKDGFTGLLFAQGEINKWVISGKYTPEHTKFVTAQTNKEYSQDDYSGTLSEYIYSGSDVDSIDVSAQTSSDYNSGGYSGILSRYVYSGSAGDSKYVSGQMRHVTTQTNTYTYNSYSGTWDTNSVNKSTEAPSKKNYSSGGYSGTLSISGGGLFYESGGQPNSSTSGTTHTWTRHWDAYYAGTVYNPDDTRVYRYRGTVYKPDTRVYRFQGEVTRPESDTRIWRYSQYYEGVVSKIIN